MHYFVSVWENQERDTAVRPTNITSGYKSVFAPKKKIGQETVHTRTNLESYTIGFETFTLII